MGHSAEEELRLGVLVGLYEHALKNVLVPATCADQLFVCTVVALAVSTIDGAVFIMCQRRTSLVFFDPWVLLLRI